MLRRLFLLLCMVSIIPVGGESQTATSVREADAVCGKCHAEILRSYLQTPMAKASGLAVENLHAGSYKHAPSQVEYQVGARDDGAWLHYRLPGDSPVTGEEKLQYSLGSGHLGLTYLYSKNNYWFESPVAHYSSLDGYAMKPGLGQATQMPAALSINTSCLRCHMSSVQLQDAGTENRYGGLPFLHVGITCESCHGDTRSHVSSGGKAPVVNPAKLTAEKRDSTCIVCHLEGDTSVERRGRHANDFKPGEDIREYVSYFAFAGANTTRRAVGEIEQFSSSRCKVASGPAMSCMNCHDPHASPGAERVAFYRSRCLVCHTQEKFASEHYSLNQDCTSCHMPKTGAQNIAHVAWTDHRIRQRPDQLDSLTGLDSATTLVPILETENRPRDLALAYYNLAVKGKDAERPRAAQMVAAALQVDPEDEALLRAMGILAEWNGDFDTAKRSYLSLLKKDPKNLVANSNLGTLLAKSGDLQGAVHLWQQAFQMNEDLPQLGGNLAVAECRLGNREAAEEALRKVLEYSPDLREVRARLAEIESGREACPASSTGGVK